MSEKGKKEGRGGGRTAAKPAVKVEHDPALPRTKTRTTNMAAAAALETAPTYCDTEPRSVANVRVDSADQL